jgi:hypothetical protein
MKAPFEPSLDNWLHPLNIRASYERELVKLLKAREELFDVLDQFPRNAKAEARRKRMDRMIHRLRLSIHDLNRFACK